MGTRCLRSLHVRTCNIGKNLASIFKTFAGHHIDRRTGAGVTGQRHTKAKLGKTAAGRPHNHGRRSRVQKSLGTPGSRTRKIFHVRSLRGCVFGRFCSGILSNASCNFGGCSYRRHSIRNRGRNRQIGPGRTFLYGHTLVRRADPDADNCPLLFGVQDTRNHLRIEAATLAGGPGKATWNPPERKEAKTAGEPAFCKKPDSPAPSPAKTPKWVELR